MKYVYIIIILNFRCITLFIEYRPRCCDQLIMPPTYTINTKAKIPQSGTNVMH